LEAVQHVIRWCDIDAVDPVMSSDVALRLGLLYESAALLRTSRDPAGIVDCGTDTVLLFFLLLCNSWSTRAGKLPPPLSVTSQLNCLRQRTTTPLHYIIRLSLCWSSTMPVAFNHPNVFILQWPEVAVSQGANPDMDGIPAVQHTSHCQPPGASLAVHMDSLGSLSACNKAPICYQ